MAKLSLVAVSLAALLGATQVYAQPFQDCKSAVARTEGALPEITDAELKREAVQELAAAKDLMAKKDDNACLERLLKFRERLLARGQKIQQMGD
jgi:hypothetical protein